MLSILGDRGIVISIMPIDLGLGYPSTVQEIAIFDHYVKRVLRRWHSNVSFLGVAIIRVTADMLGKAVKLR